MNVHSSSHITRFPFLKLWFYHTVPLLVFSLPFLCAFAFQVHYFLEQIPRIQIRPELLASLYYGFWLFLTLSFFYFLYALRRMWKKTLPSRWKVTHAIVSVFLQLLMRLIVLLLAFLVSYSLFDLQFVDKAISPDNSRIAYLYTYGLFCGYSIFWGEPRGIFIRETYQSVIKCKSHPADKLKFFLKLSWKADSSRAEVISEE